MNVRIGVLGTGAIGRDHARRIAHVLSGASVVALYDYNTAAAEAVKKEVVPEAEVFSSAEALIASDRVDAIVITAIDAVHEPYVLAAIAAGKPCFCEKPLATTAAGALRIVQAESQCKQRLVQVGFMRRYDAGYNMLKHVVETEIGRPLMVHAAHRNPTVPDAYDTPMAISNTMIHEIDVLRWLLQDGYVSAQVIFPRSTTHTHAKLKDPQIVLLETAKGIRIDIEIFVNCRYGYDIQCQVVGEEGLANLPEPMSVVSRKNARLGNPILTDWKDRFIASYDVELQDFIHAAAKGTASGPTAWDGYLASITADACIAAQNAPGSIIAIANPPKPAFYS